ncbi:MAG: IPT/TIG domain-containing protein, partial [Planctomycetes bacterium]|nr:IPT/TIG domain-containing protein [Planctomycetota bacterium]
MSSKSKNRNTIIVGAVLSVLFLVFHSCSGGSGGGGGVLGGTGFTSPTVTGVSPVEGGEQGGTTITITGTNFAADATVRVGSNEATDVNVVKDTEIICTTQAGSGLVNVSVRTSIGTGTLLDAFTYHPGPKLTSADPFTGFSTGGATLTLTGSGFTANSPGPNTVTLADTAASSVTAVDDTTITCILPAFATGSADVTVSNANGTTTLSKGFTYYGFPPSFLGTDKRLDTDPPGVAESYLPEICCDGLNVYVTWCDTRNGVCDIYFNHSTDGGKTWQTTDTRLDSDRRSVPDSVYPKICCDGLNVYVTWYDYKNGYSDIYFNASTDGGESWPASEKRLNTDSPGASQSYCPEICCDGSRVYVTWYDN